MKNIYKLFAAMIVFATLASCSTYSKYWHEEEDDVYFTTLTPEEVEIYSSYEEDKIDREYDSNRDRRTYEPIRNRRYDTRRRRTNTYYPPVYRQTKTTKSPGKTNTPTRTSKPSKKSPTPTRSTRPSRNTKSSKPE